MRFPVIFFMAFLFAACSSRKEIIPPAFKGEEAFDCLVKQVSFGPRVPGTENSRHCQEYLISFFESLGAQVDTMQFIHRNPLTFEETPMVNILVHFHGTDSDSKARYLLAAHYDSRPRAENDSDPAKKILPIPGANDGASGVAVLMELGRLFSEVKPRVNVDMALFDGEDWGEAGNLDEYFLGAKNFVTRIPRDHYRFAILLDMVGDKDLKIYKEQFSSEYAPKITNLIWKTAAELGQKAFVDSVGYAVYDDHLSLLTIGIPAADVIDFVYPEWHTSHDTPENCSPHSLASVGMVISTLIYRL
ncbi:Peptidase M28 [Candidatus Zixiibacteriota bacterium]|nr:Peptidase M28 [candidate division Zixibacteria bacterium]